MAHENVNGIAAAGTDKKTQSESAIGTGCPTWDSLGAGIISAPFLRTDEAIKRAGFQVRFLSDRPRRETDSRYNEGAKELWFDVEFAGEVMTWTVSQKSLLLELKKHEPLTGKRFDIRLVPVDAEFRERHPKYKGKDRYDVRQVPDQPAVGHGQGVTPSAPSLPVVGAA